MDEQVSVHRTSPDIVNANPDTGNKLTVAQSRYPVTSQGKMRGFTNPSGINADVCTAE